MSTTKYTTDHVEVRKWAENRGGTPSFVKGTTILRVDFEKEDPDPDEDLEETSWEEFFKAFEENNLALIYRDEDRFNKFVDRDSIE